MENEGNVNKLWQTRFDFQLLMLLASRRNTSAPVPILLEVYKRCRVHVFLAEFVLVTLSDRESEPDKPWGWYSGSQGLGRRHVEALFPEC